MSKSVKQLLEDAGEKRHSLLAETKAILSKAEDTQILPEADDKRCAEIMLEVEGIDRYTATLQAEPPGLDDAFADVTFTSSDEFNSRFIYPGDSGVRQSRGPVFTDSDGETIQAFNGNVPLSRTNGIQSGDIGNAVHSILQGRPLNVNVGSTDSSGGYIINPEFGSRFIDLARSASVVMRAGAISIPMNSSELVLAGQTSDPTSHWRAETVAVTSSDMAFEIIRLKAKTLACIVPVSIEMLEDASNAAGIIESAIQASMAQKLDAAGLSGTGAASAPKGIRNHADVNAIASVGTPGDYTDFSLAVGDVMAANYSGEVEGLSWINHPRTDDTLDGLQDTTNPTASTDTSC